MANSASPPLPIAAPQPRSLIIPNTDAETTNLSKWQLADFSNKDCPTILQEMAKQAWNHVVDNIRRERVTARNHIHELEAQTNAQALLLEHQAYEIQRLQTALPFDHPLQACTTFATQRQNFFTPPIMPFGPQPNASSSNTT